MDRYVYSYDEWFGNLDKSMTVYENTDPVNTGLLDKHGHTIYRVPERVKLGFDLDGYKSKK